MTGHFLNAWSVPSTVLDASVPFISLNLGISPAGQASSQGDEEL